MLYNAGAAAKSIVYAARWGALVDLHHRIYYYYLFTLVNQLREMTNSIPVVNRRSRNSFKADELYRRYHNTIIYRRPVMCNTRLQTQCCALFRRSRS